MFQTRQEMYNHIVTSMGGRVAEKLKMDDISVGASGDIQQATNIAREMVTKYGFSDQLGNVNYGGDGEVFLGADLTAHKTYSEETASMIDEEIRRIIGEAFALAEKILTENNDRLERVAQALLLVETIDGEQFEALYTGAMEPEDLKKSVDEEKELQKKQDEVEAKETERILREKAEIEAREAAQREKGYITLGEAYDGEDPDTKEGE
jgi:cell division protease FtsH